MNRGMNSPAYSGALLWSQACGPARNRPCSRACMQTGADAGIQPSTETPAKTASRKARCPLGFSEMQIAILSLLKAQPPLIAYWQIAEAITRLYGLDATEGAVRGALERLGKRGFLVRSRCATGRAQGNRYAFSSDPCPHISPPSFPEPGAETPTEAATPTGENPMSSFLKEKTDRRNLSVFSEEQAAPSASQRLEFLCEEDIAFHWPNLSKIGFGTCQIRQILGCLFQVGLGAENLAQGLTHAEWELEQGAMRDKNGEPVSHPLNWVLSSLARTGYHRRPQGYVSPQEQAKRDAASEGERLKIAREERKNSAFEAWRSGLSPKEKRAIVAPENRAFPMPEDTALRQHFLREIWPVLLKNGVHFSAEIFPQTRGTIEAKS
ncbi:MAG: hypothetical protein HDQ92_03510 [Desulfovibrio sp.]|nr:hypothetical protein [Desulfovibrio sp.]